MYLVDINVISAGAPSRVVPPALVQWMNAHSIALFLSAVTVAEIEDGIVKARREGATRKATDLAAWLETLLHLYDDHILAFDTARRRAVRPCPRSGSGARVRRHHHRGHRATSRADDSVPGSQAFRTAGNNRPGPVRGSPAGMSALPPRWSPL